MARRRCSRCWRSPPSALTVPHRVRPTGLRAADRSPARLGGAFGIDRARRQRRGGRQRAGRRHGGDTATAGATGWSAADGGIFSYGDAGFFGSAGVAPPQRADRRHGRDPGRRGLLAGGRRRRHLQLRRRRLLRLGRLAARSTRRSSAWRPPATARGYWLVASDGGIFSYGDARFAGSTGGLRAQRAGRRHGGDPDGGGYWLVARDGGIFTYGDARLLRLGRRAPRSTRR